jgi:hypothetical protein
MCFLNFLPPELIRLAGGVVAETTFQSPASAGEGGPVASKQGLGRSPPPGRQTTLDEVAEKIRIETHWLCKNCVELEKGRCCGGTTERPPIKCLIDLGLLKLPDDASEVAKINLKEVRK